MEVPEDVANFVKSPWHLSVLLSQSLSPYTPERAYWSMKLAVLLSLIGACSKDSATAPVSILVVHPPGGDPAAARLLAEAGRFVQGTNTVHGTANKTLTVTAATDARAPHQLTVNAGSLLDAEAQGLTTIPFLEHLKPQELDALHRFLETGAAETELTQKARASTAAAAQSIGSDAGRAVGGRMLFSGKTTVWASTSMKKPGGGGGSGGGGFLTAAAADVPLKTRCSHLPLKLLAQFDLVFVLDDSPDETNDHEMASHLFELLGAGASNDDDDDFDVYRKGGDDDSTDDAVTSSAVDDLKKVLAHAAVTPDIEVDGEASCLLRDFYLASRRMRSSQRQAVEITKKSLQTMIQLAKNHARASLRSAVTTDDALMAIMLYEETLAAKHQTSVFHFLPLTSPWKRSIDTYQGFTTADCMKTFYDHVQRFIAGNLGSSRSGAGAGGGGGGTSAADDGLSSAGWGSEYSDGGYDGNGCGSGGMNIFGDSDNENGQASSHDYDMNQKQPEYRHQHDQEEQYLLQQQQGDSYYEFD